MQKATERGATPSTDDGPVVVGPIQKIAQASLPPTSLLRRMILSERRTTMTREQFLAKAEEWVHLAAIEREQIAAAELTKPGLPRVVRAIEAAAA